MTQDVTPYGVAGVPLLRLQPERGRVRASGRLSSAHANGDDFFAGRRRPASKRARLLFEYDFVLDYLGRTSSGVPTDARNDTWTARLQVNL